MKHPRTKSPKIRPKIPSELLSLWKSGISAVDPVKLISPFIDPESQDDAILCWGKAAKRSSEAFSLRKGFPGRLIAPQRFVADLSQFILLPGNHPLPKEESFKAAEGLLDYFDSLRRFHIRRLQVFLSGGASSLAWLRPSRISAEELQHTLTELYAARMNILELNRARAKLCGLKAGGTARWLQKLAPKVAVTVHLISDVLPFGPEVVGSGPFALSGGYGKIKHKILADNGTLVKAIASEAKKKNLNLISVSFGQSGQWESWVNSIARQIRGNKSGIMIKGGEPTVLLPIAQSGKGGRMTQIAAALLDACFYKILAGKMEALCMSSDGSDGSSDAAGVYLSSDIAKYFNSTNARKRLKQAIQNFDTARALGEAKALIASPAEGTGTNVQDVVLIRLKG